MSKEREYAPDSDDESDEDFCPEKEAAAGESVSEEEDDGDAETNDEPKPKASARIKTVTKRKKTKILNKAESEDEADECNSSRRSTRLGGGNVCEKSSIEKNELESDEEEKSRTDALWADFMSDVKPAPSKQATTLNGSSTSKAAVVENKESSNQTAPQQMKVTEIYDFAGKEVCVEKTVDTNNINKTKTAAVAKAGNNILKRPAAALSHSGRAGGGIGSFLNQVGKKKKMSVLEKTKLDWNSFKQNEGIEEQLQTFNKGRDGFLERQDFLQRTDLRQFEVEKSLRQARRN